jgi:Zn-dependent protease/predicted transcriptional regulator
LAGGGQERSPAPIVFLQERGAAALAAGGAPARSRTMFGRSFPLFKLAGFQVGVDWSWLIIAVLITWTLSIGVFPFYYPELAPATYWSMGVVAALGLFASIILHELAHAVVARRHGLPIRGITLFVFGGVAEMEGEPDRPGVEFQVAIAGPIASFVIGLGCGLLVQAAAAAGAGVAIVGVIAYLAMINVILAVFNLVPAFPLDGGRMLRAALWRWKGSLRWATRISALIGGGFGILLIVLGVWQVLMGNFIGGMWWFLIGLFVRAAAQMSYRQVVVREGLRGMPVRKIMKTDPIAVPAGISIATLVDDYLYRHQHKMFPVVEGDRLVGCVGLREVKTVPREQWASTTVREIAQGSSEATSTHPDADALEVLSLMNRTQNSRLLVTDGGRLVGVVTLKDMLKFLSLKLDLEESEEVDLRLAGLGRPRSGRS